MDPLSSLTTSYLKAAGYAVIPRARDLTETLLV